MDKERLDIIVNNFQNKRVAILGDLMLDAYVIGTASRISQEAPVPVVQVKEMHQTLGGAANVMRNVVTLGGKADAFGLIGNDSAGKDLKRLLESYEINHDTVLVDESRRTIQKKRVIASSQQLVRIDYEDIHPVSVELKDAIVSKIIEKMEDSKLDAVIFEDYAKGLLDVEMLNQIIAKANQLGVITTLDPHPGHPLEAKDLTLITPNRSEAFGLAGIYCSDPLSPVEKDVNLEKVSTILQKKWEAKHLLITLGAQGMALFSKNGERFVIPTRAREVFDVSGAGDTVIAAYTLALLGGATAVEAAEIANHAAGVVVGKVGTVSVELSELQKSFNENGDN